jgi:putative membrane protein
MSKTTTIHRMLGVATLAMMFGAGSAWAQAAKDTSKDTAAAATTTQQDKAGSASGAASGKLSRADEKVMKDLAYANISEIEAGKMAQAKSSNEQVKTFAQKMIDDHTKAQQDLQTLAQTKGVTLPSEPDAKHKAAAKMMGALSGDKFDKVYLKQGGLNDHRTTHKLLARATEKATDPDLKALISKTAPVVDQHLTMAQDISSAKSTGNMSGSSMGSAGTSGKSESGTSGSSGSTGASGTSGSSNSTKK